MAKQFKTTIAPPSLSSDPAGTVAGEIYYSSVNGALKIYNGSIWNAVGSGSSTDAETYIVMGAY